ncbi:MAG: inositol 2-dehydrogenase [Spirochaetales bacterium]|nr:inositol 2-dehydrogenase [Spirochaetales bacterium]
MALTGEKVRMGLIGAGRIGRMHAEHLSYRLPGAELVSVSDVYLEGAEKCASDYNIPNVYKDYRKVLEDKDIDAVVICTSTNTHAEIIEAAAEAGKDIFCEKPIALDIAKIDHALETVGRTGVKLQIGFNRRFDPNFLKIKKMVSAGEIGEPHILKITSRDPAPPPLEYVKVSGGIFLDMMIHDFDMARYLIGDEVEEIYASGNVLIDERIKEYGDIDTAIVTLKFRNGTIGSIDNSRQAVYGYDQRVEVFGSKGNAAAYNELPDHVELTDKEGSHTAKPLYFFMERYTKAYLSEMEEFLKAIRNNTNPPVTGMDGKIPVVMGMAAKKSLAEHRPVKVEF